MLKPPGTHKGMCILTTGIERAQPSIFMLKTAASARMPPFCAYAFSLKPIQA